MTNEKEKAVTMVSEENIYRLNGRVPLRKAIPFGLQHVLAMFVSNLAPVLIVCSAAIVRSTGGHLSSAEITQLLQCAMFVAGIGTIATGAVREYQRFSDRKDKRNAKIDCNTGSGTVRTDRV